MSADQERSDPEPSRQQILLEFTSASNRSEEHRKVKWNHRRAMINRFRLCLDVCEFGSKRRWLDVGCGTGAFQRMVGDRFPRLERVGIDLSPDLIRYARSREVPPNTTYEVRGFLDRNEETYDLLTAIGILQFTNLSVRSLVRRGRDLLEKGGTMFLETKQRGNGDLSAPARVPGSQLRWFRPDELTDPAREAGFTVERTGGFDPLAGEMVDRSEARDLYVRLVR